MSPRVAPTSSPFTMDVRTLERLRAPIYRTSRAKRLQTMTSAVRFLNQVGFCWLFAPGGNAPELPSLFEAVKGRRGMRIFDWDEDSDRVWGWKSDLPAARLAYYGKALLGKPVFVSLEMLPYLLAASGTDDIERVYRAGGISYEARKIYMALESLGPQPTRALRSASGMDGKNGTVRYHRALDELQRRMLVMPVGATNEGNNWPSQIFELVARWLPSQAERGRRLEAHEARCTLVDRYLKTVVGAPTLTVGRLLGIPRSELDSLVEVLSRRELVQVRGEWILTIRAATASPLRWRAGRGRP